MKKSLYVAILIATHFACSNPKSETPKAETPIAKEVPTVMETSKPETPKDLFTKSDDRMLKYMGITKEQVIEDGLKQAKLIDQEGILGGTMRIVDVKLVNYKWAYATFEDGHISGHLMLKYDVKNGKIEWTVIDKNMIN